jgi:predicted secreted protein
MELESMAFLWNLQTSTPKDKRTIFEDACFEQRVQELKAYRDTNGHCRVPARYEPNKALGYWVDKVRTQYKWRGQGKKNALTDARILKLHNLGFVWNGHEGIARDVWMQRVEDLLEYRDTNGHCRVPARYGPNKALGYWVSTVRAQYTWREQGKKTTLTDAHISELDGLGFVWRVRTDGSPRDEVWKKRMQELTAYRDTNGHCRVPFPYKPNKALGRWANKVRTRNKTSLTDARISELDGLGFVWTVYKPGTEEGLSADELWKKRVQELVAYRDTNGHCRVPFLYEPNKALGNWVSTVRTQYTWREQGKKTSLTEAHISELYGLGFVWRAETDGSPRDDVWKKRVQELVAYRDTNGHCRVPARYEPNKALGYWVDKVRTRYKKTSLTDAHISELDGLGFVWKLYNAGTKEGLSGDELWRKRVQELVAYRDTNGHCRVPFLYEPNKALGHWVSTVRTQYTWREQGKKNSLTDAHISELDGLGFVWKVFNVGTKEGLSGDELWRKRVQELVAYRDTNGHCRVPFLYEPNKALGHWVSTVRSQYTWREQGENNSLTDAHISELDGLGFVWKAGTKEKEGSPRDEVLKKRVQELTAFNHKYLETYRLNPLLLHKQTEELLQKRRRDYDSYLWALRSYPL